MSTFPRALLAFMSAVMAFYMTLWVVGALVLPRGTPFVVNVLLSVATAAWAGRYMWRRVDFSSPGLAGAIMSGALAVGGAGFILGFFGPLIFAPQANQGPLLGLFITGPLGALAGAIGGGLRWWWRGGAAR